MATARPTGSRQPPLIEGDESTTYVPGGGNQPIPGEKSHIWQEFEQHQRSGLRPIKGARFWGGAWWLLPLAIVIAAVATEWRRWDSYAPSRDAFLAWVKAWFQ